MWIGGSLKGESRCKEGERGKNKRMENTADVVRRKCLEEGSKDYGIAGQEIRI